MNRPKAVVVLNALLTGVPVQLGRFTYMMGQDEAGKDLISVRCWKDPGHEEVLIASDISVNQFLAECDKLSADDVFIIGCEKVLTEEGQRRAARRK